MKIQHAILHNAKKEIGFSGSVIHENTFCAIEVQNQYTKEEGHVFIQTLKTILHNAKSNMELIDSTLKEKIREGNLPSGISIAIGVFQGNNLHLKTYGLGQVWIKRGTQLANLIKGNQSAVGPFNPDDTFIFTTDSFLFAISTPTTVVPFLENPMLVEGVHELGSFVHSQTEKDFIALFVRVGHQVEQIQAVAMPQTAAPIPNPQPTPYQIPMAQPQQSVATTETAPKKKFSLGVFSQAGAILHSGKRNRIITFAFVFIIVLILIWSVGFGYKRRQEAQILTKITHTKELVTQKLNQSDEVSFLNPERSLILLSEAHTEVNTLKKELGVGYEKQIAELEEMVRSREDQITHKENKSGDEFYDLTLDNKNAIGTKLSLDGDTVSILDPKNGSVYTLSLEKKSLDKQTAGDLKSASLIVRYEDSIYAFIPSKGLYSLQSSGAKKLIDADREWGSITDIQVYNGNLYFLDASKGQIYKYVPTDSGFSEKTSYIKSGQDTSVRGASSLAIDSSSYVSVQDTILKFTAGVLDEFKTSFPEDGVQINKVITTKELEKVYAWDKSKGVLYVLAKNGAYERQVKSSTFAQADDVVVYNNMAYALQKEKIYKVSVE